MKLLKLTNINKHYKLDKKNKFYVLKDINISFKSGELNAVIGESGSGKSTFMNLIGLLDSSFTGEININGQDVGKLKSKQIDEFRKKNIGFIFQSFNLISHLNILDNVTIPLILMGVGKSERERRGKEILRRLGIEKEIYKKPDKLSGGQKQRAAIARALINNPDIIIADEPTGSLDSKTSMQILNIIKDMVSDGKMVIMVTHSEKVASFADRIIEIKDGSIVNDFYNDKSEVAGDKYINEKDYGEKKFLVKKVYNKNKNLSFISSVVLSLKNMKEKLLRNSLVSIGGSIGITSVILMLSFGNGVKTYFNNIMDGCVNPLVVEVNMPEEDEEQSVQSPEANNDISVLNKIKDDSLKTVKINNTEAFTNEDINKLENIKGVSGVKDGYNLVSIGANSLSFDGTGCNIIRFSTISPNMTASRISEGQVPGSGEILINKAVEDRIGSDVIGKQVTLKLLLCDKKVSKIFVICGVYSSVPGDLNSMLKSAFINYSDLKDIYSENNMILKPNTEYVISSDESYISSIKEDISNMGYSNSSQEEMTNLFNDMISILTYVLSAIAAISLIVSSIMILVVLFISVVERTKEIGILKAIGARRKDIRRIFMCESSLIGVFSGIIGCIFSLILMRGMNIFSNKLFEVNIVIINKNYLILGCILSITVSTIAGLMPALRASKLDPIISLRRE